MLDFTSNTSLGFFFVNQFLRECDIGKMENLGNEPGHWFVIGCVFSD